MQNSKAQGSGEEPFVPGHPWSFSFWTYIQLDPISQFSGPYYWFMASECKLLGNLAPKSSHAILCTLFSHSLVQQRAFQSPREGGHHRRTKLQSLNAYVEQNLFLPFTSNWILPEWETDFYYVKPPGCCFFSLTEQTGLTWLAQGLMGRGTEKVGWCNSWQVPTTLTSRHLRGTQLQLPCGPATQIPGCVITDLDA